MTIIKCLRLPPKVLFLRTTWAGSEFSALLRRSAHLEDCEEAGTCPSRNLEGDCAGCVEISHIQFLESMLYDYDEDEDEDGEEQN